MRRVFPISNWTELDVWQYVAEEGLEVPSIYFAHDREVFTDMSCTGAVESRASTLAQVVAEIAATEMTERGRTRADDRVWEAAMEDRKRQGYF